MSHNVRWNRISCHTAKLIILMYSYSRRILNAELERWYFYTNLFVLLEKVFPPPSEDFSPISVRCCFELFQEWLWTGSFPGNLSANTAKTDQKLIVLIIRRWAQVGALSKTTQEPFSASCTDSFCIITTNENEKIYRLGYHFWAL